MIKFREKDFSNYIVDGALKGAALGATAGTLYSGISNKFPKFIPGSRELNKVKRDKDGKPESNGLIMTGIGTLVGAALGALVGTVREIDKKVSRTNTGSSRLMNLILDKLKERGYKENLDFTRDSSKSMEKKMKISVVFNNANSDFRILVNTINDPTLKSITNKLLQPIKHNGQVQTNYAVNKYNEINITTVKDNNINSLIVTNLVEGFIKEGYPVYIAEV